jgi:hypothetical protein
MEARLARLDAQMRRNDYLFRSICARCSQQADPHASQAPFSPFQALAPAAQPPAE